MSEALDDILARDSWRRVYSKALFADSHNRQDVFHISEITGASTYV